MEPLSSQAELDWVLDALAMDLAEPASGPLSRRLYLGLRERIQTGRLAPGSRLPSSRRLARELGLGRNTVLAALEQLAAEGFLETRPGAGTFIADLPQLVGASSAPGTVPEQTSGFAGEAPQAREVALSSRGTRLLGYSPGSNLQPGVLTPGLPALERFPQALWQRLMRRHLHRAPTEWLGYQTQGGVPALREALCDYLRLSRSVRCRPEQILIVQGAQQGFELIARLLTDPGDRAWVEEPGYGGAKACFEAAGLELHAVPVDDEGLQVASDLPAPRLIQVTPSHQYPSGVTMTLGRRLALLEAAKKHGAWIVEDDYDSEFRYGQSLIAALQGLDHGGRVLYVGTFSKVLYPGLRLGYVVLPEALVDPCRRANARLHRESQYVVQSALAEFIAAGHFSRHVRRMRDCYRDRQARLREALAPAVRMGLELSEGQAGMHLVAWLDDHAIEAALVARGLDHGIGLSPLSTYYLTPPGRPGLVLGYAGASEEEIDRAGGWLCREWLALTAKRGASSMTKAASEPGARA